MYPLFSLFGIPVQFTWWFFIVLAFLGAPGAQMTEESLLDIGLFVMSGTVSILVHEFGHALVGRRLGGTGPVIHLHGMGGLCSFQRAQFTRKQDFLMTLAGPGAGFALFGLSVLILKFLPTDSPIKILQLVEITARINFVWSTLNLLPVLPLDGGRLLQALLGPKRLNITLIIGMITAICLMPLALKFGFILLPVLLGFFAFQHLKSLQALGRR